MNKLESYLKKLLTRLLILVLLLPSLTNLVMAQETTPPSGELTLISGTATINGVNAPKGATVFPTAHVRTDNNSSATITFGKQGQIELAPGSDLILQIGSNEIGGQLQTGRVTVSTRAGIRINVTTADGKAIADGSIASTMTVDVSCGNTRVAPAINAASVRAGRREEKVAAGQEVTLGLPQDTAKCVRIAPRSSANGGVGTISGTALAALVILGVGGAVAGLLLATQSNSETNNGTILSAFRP